MNDCWIQIPYGVLRLILLIVLPRAESPGAFGSKKIVSKHLALRSPSSSFPCLEIGAPGGVRLH